MLPQQRNLLMSRLDPTCHLGSTHFLRSNAYEMLLWCLTPKFDLIHSHPRHLGPLFYRPDERMPAALRYDPRCFAKAATNLLLILHFVCFFEQSNRWPLIIILVMQLAFVVLGGWFQNLEVSRVAKPFMC